MAKLILEDSYPSKVSSFHMWWRIVIVGASMGALYWLFTVLINNFVTEPIFCGASLNAQICSNSVETSGNLAVILTMVAGLGILVRLGTMRPLIVTVATTSILWGLAGWTNGLAWAEVVSWNVALFTASYLLFSWISRYTKSMTVIVASLIVVIAVRILVAL